jgi:hypothetical protein
VFLRVMIAIIAIGLLWMVVSARYARADRG